MTIENFKKYPALTKKELEKLEFYWIEQDPVKNDAGIPDKLKKLLLWLMYRVDG